MMTRVFRFDGKEMFINPSNIMFLEERDDYVSALMVDGKEYSLSRTALFALTDKPAGKKGLGFDTHE